MRVCFLPSPSLVMEITVITMNDGWVLYTDGGMWSINSLLNKYSPSGSECVNTRYDVSTLGERCTHNISIRVISVGFSVFSKKSN